MKFMPPFSRYLIIAFAMASGPFLRGTEGIPNTLVSYGLDSRYTPSDPIPGGLSAPPIYLTVVSEVGAAWLRLHFGDFYLGDQGFLLLTSLADQSQQLLNAQQLNDWGGDSAYFNGDSVSVELFGSPKSSPYFQISAVTMGHFVEGGSLLALQGICDGVDDRTASDHPAVGRMIVRSIGQGGQSIQSCTAWITANGFATAGHCFDAGPGFTLGDAIVGFNIPDSLCDGTIQNPDVANQYRAILGSVSWSNLPGRGQDWAVFQCMPNNGNTAAQAQNAFLRVRQDVLSDNVTLTGFGIDNDPPGCGPSGDLNSDNSTQQSHTGLLGGEYDTAPDNVWLEYAVDTTDGTSGSPVMLPGGEVAIGIHHDGSCASNLYNAATSFAGSAIRAALNGLTPPQVVYVDAAHPALVGEGTVLQPYKTLAAAVAAAAPGKTLTIFGGDYPEALVIDKPLLLEAVWGAVVVGEDP